MTRILIRIKNDIYDVTDYISKHPGEGIKNKYLRNYHRQNTTREFNIHHLSEEAYTILERTKNRGYDEQSKIYYVSPFFFTTLDGIPEYFKFNPNDLYFEKYMENKPDKFFVLRRSNSDLEESLYITYKNHSNVKHIKVEKKIDGWLMIWNVNNIYEKIQFKNLEELINNLITEKGLTYNI